MKKLIFITLLSFSLGFSAISFFPKTVLVEVSGDIAIKNKKELVNDSEIIIKGKVAEVLPSFWSNPDFEKGMEIRNIIQTDILVDVEKVYKNKIDVSETIKVRINKGTIGETIYKSEGYPDFEIGEEVVLFLAEDDSDLANPDENYYVLTGMTQGKFFLPEGKG